MKRPMLWVVMALFLSSCTTINLREPEAQAPKPPSAPPASAAASSAASKPELPFKPAKEVLKDTRVVPGFISLNVKRDNTVFASLTPDQMDQDFGLVMHYSSGNGVLGIQEGLYLSETRVMRFIRAADKINLVHRNMRLVADAGSPMEKALSNNVAHSIVQTFDIAAYDSSTKALVIDLTPFLVSDYAGIAESTKNYFPNQREPQFNKTSSWVDRVQGFPKNVEIDAKLSFKPAVSPTSGRAGLPDSRSFTAGVRYSLFALPEVPMAPRAADNRLGYFVDASLNFSDDRSWDPMQRRINRWRLEKKDPTAEISDPVKPITYYVDWSVPTEYRPFVKEGIEGWNKAFAAAGFSNAIVAMDPPVDDSTWSAEDIRYSTIRWTAAYRMGYAIGPSETDPRSGEILNADILLSSEFVGGWGSQYETLIGPQGMLTRFEEMDRALASSAIDIASRTCFYEMGLKHDIGLLNATLMADGLVGEIPIELIGEELRALTMHEVGHTLGLMHNFESSQAIPFEKLHDKDFTRDNGVTASVMDYDLTNINPDRSKQGYYTNPEVGAYDVWVIQYGYTPFEQDKEAEGLAAIAARSSEPLLTYGSHEDLVGGGIDPYITPRDMSDDLIAFAKSRNKLVSDLEPRMEARLIADGDSYERLRSAYNGLLVERFRMLTPITKLVGGVYFSRDHKGTPNARVPMTPVSAAEQKEAVDFIVASFLAEDAIRPSADRLNRMAPGLHLDWNYSLSTVDVPYHATVAAMQESLLTLLTSPVKLARMVDNEVRMPGGADAYTVAELFHDLTAGVWTEASARKNVSSIRRNLQRAYVDRMGAIVMNDKSLPSDPSWPDDARAAARLELTEMVGQIDAALGAGTLDRSTKAHYLDSRARIDAALELGVTRMVR